MSIDVLTNKNGEFSATKENIEKLLKNGAQYVMGDMPHIGVNLISWDTIDKRLTEGINLNNCPYVNTVDEFILGEITYYPISQKAFEKYKPQEKYDKENTQRFSIKLNNSTDSAIIDWLNRQPNKQGAIKEALKKAMLGDLD